MDKCRVRAKAISYGETQWFARTPQAPVWPGTSVEGDEPSSSPESSFVNAERGAPTDTPAGFTYAAEEKEVMDTGLLEVRVAGRSLCLVMANGVFYAVDNDCPHAHSPCRKATWMGIH